MSFAAGYAEVGQGWAAGGLRAQRTAFAAVPKLPYIPPLTLQRSGAVDFRINIASRLVCSEFQVLHAHLSHARSGCRRHA